MQPWEDIEEDTTLISRLEGWLGTLPNKQAKVSDAAHHFGVETVRIDQAAQDSWCLALAKSVVDGEMYVCVDTD